MNINDIFQTPAAQADFIGADGLLHCGVCGEAKEAFFSDPIPGVPDRHPVHCRCRREVWERQEAESQVRRHREKVARLKARCFKYPEMQRWTFDGAIQTRQYGICQKYAESWPEPAETNTGLLLWGGVGTGKSYLAACIANALLDREVPVYMTNLADVIGCGFDSREEYFRRLCDAPLLILDDLGMERSTSFGQETVFQVVDGRCIRQKPLIVTTNLTLRELEDASSTDRFRIYDRVLSVTTPVRFAGENLRARRRKETMASMRAILKKGQRGDSDGQ